MEAQINVIHLESNDIEYLQDEDKDSVLAFWKVKVLYLGKKMTIKTDSADIAVKEAIAKFIKPGIYNLIPGQTINGLPLYEAV
jgi:hypothetical protein